MTNVKEVILPRDKRKDGTWNVKIRVTHQRKVKYISTSLYVTEKHIRKDFTIKDPTILRALNPTLDDLRAKIADLGIKLEVYSLDRLLKCLEGNEVVDAEGIDVIGLGRDLVKKLK